MQNILGSFQMLLLSSHLEWKADHPVLFLVFPENSNGNQNITCELVNLPNVQTLFIIVQNSSQLVLSGNRKHHACLLCYNSKNTVKLENLGHFPFNQKF